MPLSTIHSPETTADSEDQFEAYRRLGSHITERTFRGASNERRELFGIASKLFDLWSPAPFELEAFLNSARDFDSIWDRFGKDPALLALFAELTEPALHAQQSGALTEAECAACMELLQRMENVFLGLRMDDFWDHPDNRGWAMLFTMWAQSPKFRVVWQKLRHTYGIRFEYFCNQHLGLERDKPVLKM